MLNILLHIFYKIVFLHHLVLNNIQLNLLYFYNIEFFYHQHKHNHQNIFFLYKEYYHHYLNLHNIFYILHDIFYIYLYCCCNNNYLELLSHYDILYQHHKVNDKYYYSIYHLKHNSLRFHF